MEIAMLKQSDLSGVAAQAIRSNFAMRNSRAFSDPGRQVRIRAERRRQIRQWISVLRRLRNPAMSNRIANSIRHAGPLMAHDLRQRILSC